MNHVDNHLAWLLLLLSESPLQVAKDFPSRSFLQTLLSQLQNCMNSSELAAYWVCLTKSMVRHWAHQHFGDNSKLLLGLQRLLPWLNRAAKPQQCADYQRQQPQSASIFHGSAALDLNEESS